MEKLNNFTRTTFKYPTQKFAELQPAATQLIINASFRSNVSPPAVAAGSMMSMRYCHGFWILEVDPPATAGRTDRIQQKFAELQPAATS